MTAEEAVEQCEFWTTNVTETLAIGSSTKDEVAKALGASVSLPREQWTNPTGPRNWQIQVGRWMSIEKEGGEPGEREVVENPLYTRIVAEIESRKAAATA